MKKFIFGIIAAVAIMCGLALTSCHGGSRSRISSKDSVKIAKMIEFQQSPQFNDADEFTNYALTEVSYKEFVDLTSTLEPITISSIAFNAIKNNKYVDYNGFMREYRQNKSMYDVFDQETKRASSTNKHIDPPTIDEFKCLDHKPDTLKV